MEVADQWRRQWAGTAEYGKVTEGGVTRRVARAMEVLHASRPGARVRVMRAAYHSTAGPGIPASSYMLQSSRRIISSGFDLEEQPSLPNRPLEISCGPLESSPESHTETENYHVTEPDDIEISEPSKWRGSTRANSIRMPSEESSSIDNVSVVDLDSRSSSRNLHRKYSNDSENSDIQWNKRNSYRMSPLLDSPVTLSTLKYKSLLNNSSDWNTRRKSYSFEDTSPLEDNGFHNDTQAMESSTDSGICKSSELVNDQVDENMNSKYYEKRETKSGDESFKDWLSKNRANSFFKGTKFKSYRDHEVVLEDPIENNIALQSTGKVTITLPVTVEKGYVGPQRGKTDNSDDGQRKIKKVEFCKTELHFAAESGKVNIIATDEKPPPSNDFRKRRSVFVPIQNMNDRPITLFGESTKEIPVTNELDEILTSEASENDENTAATKSILKNKIPKPKPYLLGENMVFGLKDDLQDNNQQNYNYSVATAVSLINKQLQAEKQFCEENFSSYSGENQTQRTINQGPFKTNYAVSANENNKRNIGEVFDATIDKHKPLKLSPVDNRLKTRELRESDLTYFGLNTENSIMKTEESELSTMNISGDSAFRSVKLIQQVSHSVSNSEPESEDSPEYQNIPVNSGYAPIPTPRHSIKNNDDNLKEIEEVNISKNTILHDVSVRNESVKRISRRPKSQENEDVPVSLRSRSEPRKSNNGTLTKTKQQTKSTRCTAYHTKDKIEGESKIHRVNKESDEIAPLYVNLKCDLDAKNCRENEKDVIKSDLVPRKRLTNNPINKDTTTQKYKLHGNNTEHKKENKMTSTPDINRDKNSTIKRQQSLRRECTPNIHKEQKCSNVNNQKLAESIQNQNKFSNKEHTKTNSEEKYKEHRSRSLNRRANNRETTNHTQFNYRDQSPRKCQKESKDSGLYHIRRPSPEKISTKVDATKIDRKTSDTDSPVRLKMIVNKQNDKIHSSKKLNQSTTKKEYVINYDDKNGTVSSVCKMTPGSHSSRTKKILLETSKDKTKERISKTKENNLRK